jgi:hypothetical protein
MNQDNASRQEFFSALVVERLRKSLGKALRSETGEDPPEGLSISPVDPTQAIACLRWLKLKPGMALRAYQYFEGGDGNGFVLAMPENVPLPPPSECPMCKVEVAPGVFCEYPKPEAALPEVMDALVGDRSPWSLLEASILSHELSEFGAYWHGCDWSCHSVLDSNPLLPGSELPAEIAEYFASADAWKWEEAIPGEWRPSALVNEDGGGSARFITFSALDQAALYENVDNFQAGSFQPQGQCRVLAKGLGGYVH